MLLKRTSQQRAFFLLAKAKRRLPVKRPLTPSYHLFRLHSRTTRLRKLMNTVTRPPSKDMPRGRSSPTLSRFSTDSRPPHPHSKAITVHLLMPKDLLLHCPAITLQSLLSPSPRISLHLPPRLPRPLTATAATVTAVVINPAAACPLPAVLPRTRKNHLLCLLLLLLRLARKARKARKTRKTRKTLARPLAWPWLKALQPTRP